MERLTYRNKDGLAHFKRCFESPCFGMGCRISGCEHDYKVCSRLAEYEDLGLEPEQLKAIDRLYAQQCREIYELKKQLAAVKAKKEKGSRSDSPFG